MYAICHSDELPFIEAREIILLDYFLIKTDDFNDDLKDKINRICSIISELFNILHLKKQYIAIF